MQVFNVWDLRVIAHSDLRDWTVRTFDCLPAARREEGDEVWSWSRSVTSLSCLLKREEVLKKQLEMKMLSIMSFSWWLKQSKQSFTYNIVKILLKGTTRTPQAVQKWRNTKKVISRNGTAKWMVWDWEKSTLPGTLMNTLQALSSPYSIKQCGFHAYTYHALQDTTVQSWWKETWKTVSISNWLHIHTLFIDMCLCGNVAFVYNLIFPV